MQDPFDRVWEAFARAERTADGRHDTPHWRAHAGPYAACVIRVPADRLQPELHRLRGGFSQLPGVRLHPDHFLHVMLQELGFVLERPTQPDEISPARLEEFAQAAAGAITNLAPFSISIGGANSFQDAVFLEVRPIKVLDIIHERLFDLAAMPRLPAYPYLPHCTIAHYDGTVPMSDAIGVLASERDLLCGEFEVSEIEIVMIEPSEPYPELENYAVIPMGS